MRRVLVLVAAVALVAAGCGGGSSSSDNSSGGRPSSPAVLKILSPSNGEVVHGTTVQVKLSLQNAQIVQPTTTQLDPHKGHVHLLLDGAIVSMNYALSDTIKASPGTHTLKAEFVASDHLPWDPPVVDQVAFEVKK